jgi:hypothetical protein
MGGQVPLKSFGDLDPFVAFLVVEQLQSLLFFDRPLLFLDVVVEMIEISESVRSLPFSAFLTCLAHYFKLLLHRFRDQTPFLKAPFLSEFPKGLVFLR